MSTNFYAVDKIEESYWEGIFLGKRASGWVFQFNWHDYHKEPHEKHYYRNIDELSAFLEDKIVKDEYGKVYQPKEFMEIAMEWTENIIEFPMINTQ